MSIITLFTRRAPMLAGFEFDAVLEDTLTASVEFTQYPIESGAHATDHGIILPIKYSLIGAVSNNPLRTSLTDFTGLLVNQIGASGLLSTVAGLSAGFIAGSNDTRGSETLDFLLSLLVARIPFDVDTGDAQLVNMVITEVERTKNPENENGLEFRADLQELPTLNTTLGNTQPSQSELREGDPAQNQIAAVVNKGERALASVGEAINSSVNEVLGL